MPSPIKKIAIIGAGVIGVGWTLRLLAKNKEVYVFDPNIKQKKFLLDEIFNGLDVMVCHLLNILDGLCIFKGKLFIDVP